MSEYFVFDVRFSKTVAWSHKHADKRCLSMAEARDYVLSEIGNSVRYWRDDPLDPDSTWAVPSASDADSSQVKFKSLARIDRVVVTS
jgi:hypothetical protein